MENATQPLTIHGNLVVIDDMGTLILGGPHLGKSELCLALMDRGHALVSDDAVEVSRINHTLFGSSPKPIQGFMQIDYLGILNIEKLFGAKAYFEKHRIDICIELRPDTAITSITDPLQPICYEYILLGIKLPCFQLPQINQLPLLVETLILNYKLKHNGYDAYTDFNTRHDNLLENLNARKKTTDNK